MLLLLPLSMMFVSSSLLVVSTWLDDDDAPREISEYCLLICVCCIGLEQLNYSTLKMVVVSVFTVYGSIGGGCRGGLQVKL